MFFKPEKQVQEQQQTNIDSRLLNAAMASASHISLQAYLETTTGKLHASGGKPPVGTESARMDSTIELEACRDMADENMLIALPRRISQRDVHTRFCTYSHLFVSKLGRFLIIFQRFVRA